MRLSRRLMQARCTTGPSGLGFAAPVPGAPDSPHVHPWFTSEARRSLERVGRPPIPLALAAIRRSETNRYPRRGFRVVEFVNVKMGFPGGRKVAAQVGEHVILTDQPRSAGGEVAAPSRYTLFLASIGACIGFYALAFCQSRDISCECLALEGVLRTENGTLAGAEFHLRPPVGFPEKYRDALLRSV